MEASGVVAMRGRTFILLALCLCAVPLSAQDLGNVQVHGFVTQGFLFSSSNNYLTMKSSSGSLQWTEGAVTVTDPLSDNLRVGIQVHMYQMGEIGGPDVLVNWASGDYRVFDPLGFRAGKVKIRMGLFNESQDVDSLFLWTLLPQSMYGDDNRDYDLALEGGEVYGILSLGQRRGSLAYDGYLGENRLDAHGGYVLLLEGYGLTFPTPPGGQNFRRRLALDRSGARTYSGPERAKSGTGWDRAARKFAHGPRVHDGVLQRVD